MGTFNIALRGGMILRCDFAADHFYLDSRSWGNSHLALLDSHRKYAIEDEWFAHIECMANAYPGDLHSTLKKELNNNGEYRQARAALSGRATASPGQGPGGSTFDPTDAKSIYDAFNSGKISSSQAAALLNTIMGWQQMAVPYASAGGLGNMSHASAMAHYRAMQQQAMASGWSSLAAMAPSPPHKPTALKSEGIRAGEIIAWRGWNIRGDELLSVVAEGKPWSINHPMQGDPASGYGVHAYKAPHGPLLDNYVQKDSSTLWVIGEVALWGDVIEHEEGYRAEFARVHSLVTWHDKVSKEHRERISAAYLTAPAFKLDDAA